MAVKSLSPLVNITLMPGLEHWIAFSFAELSHSMCDESFIGPVHYCQGSACCFSISLFIEWYILPVSCIWLLCCGAEVWVMELIRMLFYLIFSWFLLWSSVRSCLYKGLFGNLVTFSPGFFPFLFYTSKQYPSLLTFWPQINVITRILLFYYKWKDFFSNTFSSVRNIMVCQLFCHF